MTSWQDATGATFVVGDHVCYTPRHGGRIQWGIVVGASGAAPLIRGASYYDRGIGGAHARLHSMAQAAYYCQETVWKVDPTQLPGPIEEVLDCVEVKR